MQIIKALSKTNTGLPIVSCAHAHAYYGTANYQSTTQSKPHFACNIEAEILVWPLSKHHLIKPRKKDHPIFWKTKRIYAHTKSDKTTIE